jgi:hypothetical protein
MRVLPKAEALAWAAADEEQIIAYYSSEIFLSARFPERQAYAASLGFGIVNFLFALPAFYTIDTFGRRNLLLMTFPVGT